MDRCDIREIVITDTDLKRLRGLLGSANGWNARDKEHLEGLKVELNRATVVPSDSIPPDVVTMNSEVLLTNVDTKESMVWWLVFPQNADIDQRKVSILAPIGTAIIGCRVGDVVELEVPSGKTRLKIDAVTFQPEAAGRSLL
ncbi:MAG: nucleoside diphosphate kinase regulator [Ignavibacteria bacterium]|nr:nucleoside diphosphate kinase regulator [Ignavibacteria bacterium]